MKLNLELLQILSIEKGKTVEECAILLGVKPNQVVKALIENKMNVIFTTVRKEVKKQTKRVRTVVEKYGKNPGKEKLKKLILSGYSRKQLADKLGCSPSSIDNWRREYKLMSVQPTPKKVVRIQPKRSEISNYRVTH